MILALPLGPLSGNRPERLELAVSLYERDPLSLGLASKVAGLSYRCMVDELDRRRIPVVRYDVDDLERERAYVRPLAGGR
jgi:predicted HTH domain antitoxin